MTEGEAPIHERELLRARLVFLRSPVPEPGADWTGVALGADRGLGDVVLVRDEDGLGNILVPVNPSSPGFANWRRRGIEASLQRMMYRRSIGYYIRVRCTARGADEAFASMASDIARQLAAAGRTVGVVVRETLDKHAAIFERASEAIPRDRLVGLVGELLALRDFALYNRDAVLNWSGPRGGHHDFEFPVDAIEVKTRLASSHAIIHVNGLDQLEVAAGTRLWLVTRELVESEAGESVGDVLRRLLAIGCSDDALAHRLAAYGLALDDPRLDEVRHSARPPTVFAVGEGFPRLVRGSFAGSELPSGVEGIEYGLRIAALSQWRVTDDDWRKEIARITSTAQ